MTSRSRINLSQIAQSLNVSVATVSNALSGKGRVSAQNAQMIKQRAAEMGYVPEPAGRALRTGRSDVLGLVLPDISNPLFPQIAQAIEKAASDAGYGVLIADSRADIATQTEAIARLVQRGVDGLIIVPRRGTKTLNAPVPFAVIDAASTPGNTVSADHWQGGQLAIKHCQDLGHSKILLIGKNPESNVQNDRIGGMISKLSPDDPPEVLWLSDLQKANGPDSPLGLAEKFRQGFTAFACVSDLLALRALTELLAAGIQVPEEASVIGYEDHNWSSVLRPSLTTLRMDLAQIARIAVEALIKSINTPPSPLRDAPNLAVRTSDPDLAIVPVSLIPRQSTGPVRHRPMIQPHNSPDPNPGTSPA